MPRKKNDILTARSFLIVTAEKAVYPLETLTQEQKKVYFSQIMKNIGSAASDYLNCRPDEARSYLQNKEKS